MSQDKREQYKQEIIGDELFTDATESEPTRQSPHRFGYSEKQGWRDSQEDALAWKRMKPEELTAKDGTEQLTPEQIGHRLWTSYQILDAGVQAEGIRSGTTASTTVYDGKGNLITATLADAASFVAIYDNDGNVLGVKRLNSVTHKPSDLSERGRVEKAGGSIALGRVNGQLAVSRAIGDKKFKDAGVISEPTIDINNLDALAEALGIDKSKIASFQVINTCDGFTDGAEQEHQSKKDHESYLMGILRDKISKPGKLSEADLSNTLADQAIKDGSRDNVSVAIQSFAVQSKVVEQTVADKTETRTILESSQGAFMLGVYDGHGGKGASTYVAEHVTKVFTEQCQMSQEAYAAQKLSVDKKKDQYDRDHKKDDQPLVQKADAPVVQKVDEPVVQKAAEPPINPASSPKKEKPGPVPSNPAIDLTKIKEDILIL